MFPGILFLPLVHSLISKWNPDRCWMNSEIPNDTTHLVDDTPGVCPLWDKNLNISVYCSISLGPSQMKNEGCRRCVWKGNTDNVCNTGRNFQIRLCCCKKPMCNKEIFEDAMPDNATHDLTKNIACIKASFMENQWTKRLGNLTYTIERQPMANTTQFCFLSFEVKGKKKHLMKLELGFARGKVKKECERQAKHEAEQCISDGRGATTCCCEHKPSVGICNSLLYQEHGFDLVMNLRENEEKQYKKEMDSAAKKLPTKFWFMDEKYHKVKPIVDGVLIVGISIYILIFMVLYEIYKPEDMDKRQRPETASKEITFSTESR